MSEVVTPDQQRRRFARARNVAVTLVLGVVVLLALPGVHIHAQDIHLRSVHYSRWVEGHAFAASNAAGSAKTAITPTPAPTDALSLVLAAEPKPSNDAVVERPVQLNRLLQRFKLSLRSSNDSDPLL
jgi:hypothetical protein